jgi:ATP-binding cassette, subfamily C (CFTR/MRP), member 1
MFLPHIHWSNVQLFLNVSLSIPVDQKVRNCGQSASGKSSLVAVLIHTLVIQEGSIMIEGVDISRIPRKVLRGRLTAIRQDPVFLRSTIRQTLQPVNLVENDSATEGVFKRGGLWSVVTNTGGLSMPMEAEDLLSHGQLQLCCLARAMLRPSKVLTVDEPTASVDLQTDKLIQQIIAEYFAD